MQRPCGREAPVVERRKRKPAWLEQSEQRAVETAENKAKR